MTTYIVEFVPCDSMESVVVEVEASSIDAAEQYFYDQWPDGSLCDIMTRTEYNEQRAAYANRRGSDEYYEELDDEYV